MFGCQVRTQLDHHPTILEVEIEGVLQVSGGGLGMNGSEGCPDTQD
jgi:hypothetical protein